jgi:hypothetical protein
MRRTTGERLLLPEQARLVYAPIVVLVAAVFLCSFASPRKVISGDGGGETVQPEVIQPEPSEGQSMNKITEIRGYISIYGNEPHTVVGLVTEDGTIYCLNIPDLQTEHALRDSQGQPVVCTGRVQESDKTADQKILPGIPGCVGIVFTVTSFVIANPL